MSCDSRFTLAAWKQAMGYRVRLLSDFWPHGAIGRLYGVFDEKLGVNTRCTFLIDAGGIVRDVVTSELSQPRDVERYLAALASP